MHGDIGMSIAPSSAGYTLSITDGFDKSTLDRSIWGNPFNGGLYWNGAFSWSAADVRVLVANWS